MADDQQVTATIDYTKVVNGEEVKESKTFTGTEAEVKEQINKFEASLKDKSGDVEKIIEEIDIRKN